VAGHMLSSGEILQAMWRGKTGRRVARRQAAARCIQAAWRGSCCRGRCRREQAAAVCLQRYWRGHRDRQACQSDVRSVVRVSSYLQPCPKITPSTRRS